MTEYISIEEARKILGCNFWGIEEWRDQFGIKFTESDLKKISVFPWDRKTLESPCPFLPKQKIKDTHFAFLGLTRIEDQPLSLKMWQNLCSGPEQPKFNEVNFDNIGKDICEKTCEFKWYLVLKEAFVSDKENLNFDQTTSMLPHEYEVLSAIEEVTKLVLYYKKTYLPLNEYQTAECFEKLWDSIPICVGHFVPHPNFGITVAFLRDNLHGLAVGRKH